MVENATGDIRLTEHQERQTKCIQNTCLKVIPRCGIAQVLHLSSAITLLKSPTNLNPWREMLLKSKNHSSNTTSPNNKHLSEWEMGRVV